MAIKVAVVDDHNVIRSGLRMVLNAQPDMDVVGDAESGEAGIELISSLNGDRPSVVVMDLMMEGMGGIEATRRVKQMWPEVNVLVLTMADDRSYLREAFGAGASGYVLKDAVDVELVDAIRSVASGGRYLHPSLGAELAISQLESQRSGRHGIGLSEREVEVLGLVAQGYSNKEIAEDLVISVRTVETHKTHIMRKTGLRARSELTKFANDAGIVTTP